MIERSFTDWDGNEVLNLDLRTLERAWLVKGETLPTRRAVGGVVDVSSTGLKVPVGSRRVTAGQLKLELLTAGQSHAEHWEAQQTILNALADVAGYRRTPGGVLDISITDVDPSVRYPSGTSGLISITAEVLNPYWWFDEPSQALTVGTPQTVLIGGAAWTGVKLTITAGAAGVTDPTIITDAGTSIWRGTIPAGQTLTVSNLRGWQCLLGAVDASLGYSGPLPYLMPGERPVTVNAPGATAELTWREGNL